jgi:hypothetical protein
VEKYLPEEGGDRGRGGDDGGKNWLSFSYNLNVEKILTSQQEPCKNLTEAHQS